jgi:YD repeat-containing protein
MAQRSRALILCLLALLVAGTLAAYAAACPYQGPVEPSDTSGYTNPSAPYLIQSCKGAPINCATGNQSEEQTDLALGGRGPGLHVTRTYNSQAAAEAKEAGAWGYGWSGPYSSHLLFNAESGAVTVVQENGATATFAAEGGKYVPPLWVQATLVKEEVESKVIYVFTLPTQEKLKFEKEGKLTEQKDRNGNAITLTYESGKLTKAKDSAGRELIFAYTGSQVTSVEDPLGRKVKYTYESSNLASVTLPGEETARWKFKYDASHQLTEMTNGRGGVTKTEYDEKHRAKKQTDPAERVLKFEYGESGGLKTTTITEPNGSTTFEKFNEGGEAVEVIQAKGTGLERKSTSEYNAAYELVKATDPLGHSTSYEYSAAGDMILEKDPEGDETKWTYNGTHDVETEMTPKGEKTTYKRDAHGNVEAIERPAPGETTQKASFKHASNGDLESATDPLGHETKFEYDTYGDLKAETDAEGDKTTWTFNKDGEQLTEVSPRGNEEGAKASEFETVTERDSQGRPKKITDPLGHETKFAYDKNGNLESTTDALGHTTKYAYDADDERTKVEKANGDTTEVAYDSMGEVKSRTDGNGHTTNTNATPSSS